jgi:ABC-2 type transport system permease protein
LAEARLGTLGLLDLLWWRPARRSLRAMDPAQALRLGAFVLLGVFFLAVLYSIFRPVTAFLWSQEQLGPLLSARALSLAFGLLFLLLLFSTLLAFLGRLVFADDAAFFVASPMAPRDYFSFRLSQSAASAAWVIPLLWFPYLWALGRAVHGGPGFILWGVLAPLPMVFLASALGAGALCLLIRRLPPERLRAGLFAAAVLSGLVFLLCLRFSRPERLADPEQARSVAAYLAGLDILEPAWWPGTWASRAVMGYLDAPGRAAAWWLLSAATAWAAWRGVVAAFGGEAFEFWSKGQESAVHSGAARARRAFIHAGPRPAWRVLLERDAVALLRAPDQRLQALLLGTLIVLFVFSLGRLPLGRDQSLKDWLYLPVSGCAQIILLAVSARFVYPAGSLERQGSWLLHHAPVGAWDHLRAKALLFSLLLLPLSLLLGGVVALVFTPNPLAEAAGLANFVVLPLSLACMNTGLGIAWARKDAAYAEEVISSPSGVLAMVLGALLVLAQNALLILPLHEAWYAFHLPQFRVHWTWVGLDLFLWVCLHGFAAGYPLAMAARKIDGILE